MASVIEQGPVPGSFFMEIDLDALGGVIEEASRYAPTPADAAEWAFDFMLRDSDCYRVGEVCLLKSQNIAKALVRNNEN